MAKLNFRSSLLRVGFTWVQPLAHSIPERYRKLKGMKFLKHYSTNDGDFEVLLIYSKMDLTRLPLAYVLKKPTLFEGVALPHISNSGYLCYADNDQAEWNPINCESLAIAIDNSISQTLLAAVENVDKLNEYRHEFSNYWQGDFTAFNFEDKTQKIKALKYGSFDVNYGRKASTSTEYVIYTENEQFNRWIELRGTTSVKESGHVIVVRVKPNNWAPVAEWPPTTFSNVLSWLAKADRSAHDNLIWQLVQFSARHILVVLRIKDEGDISFKLTFSAQYHKLLESWNRRNMRSVGAMVQPMSSSKAIQYFKRLQVESVNRDDIFLRNRPNPLLGDLRHKRIALIGCGTIGGFVAELLVKAGAGVSNKGSISLYDRDTLRPGNLGRHRLPARFLGWNKAEGLAQLIEEEALHKVYVNVYQNDFEISPDSLTKYDVVIDATGRVPVSLALATTIRSLANSRPVLIHGFNYRWGQESVAFIDTGAACYGCLRKHKRTSPAGQHAATDTSRYSCGSFYTPYDASISVITASLVVEAVLSTLEPKLNWTYTKITTDKTNSQKRLVFKPWVDCAICGRGNRH